MHLTAHIDPEALPAGQDGEITVLVKIAAPVRRAGVRRPSVTVQVVLDTSGSMSRHLAGVRAALRALIGRLDASDDFGLVTFGETARVVIPAGPLGDKEAALRAVAGLRTGGATDLSRGLLRGVHEAYRAAAGGSATLLLISDGHADRGATSPARFGEIAMAARRQGVVTTTLGCGLDYDEALLAAIADGGAGSALHAGDAGAAERLIAHEIDCVLATVAQSATLTVTSSSASARPELCGGPPGRHLPDGSISVALGDLHEDESRTVVLRLGLSGLPAPGPVTAAWLALTYLDVGTLATATLTRPVEVDIAPPEEATGRPPGLAVRAERLFQDVQDAKRAAAEAIRRDDVAGAEELLGAARRALQDALAWAPDPAELAAEAAELDRYARDARRHRGRVLKEVLASWHLRTRKRGRALPHDPPT
ncbi:hypothetical protein Sru01_61830 [Sphaerisporangium rufum]|uniref:VWFA domain-containing protein n=1 Tax=Sphaerisporangium rufum TaxID=1381558 RepID=A0A919R7P7_9ACTN|nr:VWA domain-containing protein [Sphaerisporangium rufum]GII81201.1 hypothetical protein Sru01_61830 [Sphaerisporangium rufum]